MSINDHTANCWRVRMRVSDTHNLTRQAWDKDIVGSWYGAWNHQDWIVAEANSPNDLWGYLRNLESHGNLTWKPNWVPPLAPFVRFSRIPDNDWILVHLEDTDQIGLAQIYGAIESDINSSINRDGEVFKFRNIKNKKTFDISLLPDAYRVLPSQGRQGNFHRIEGMKNHVSLLIKSADELDVNAFVSQLSVSETIDFLGPSAWESFSYAYLILKENFVPTGLSVGGTMPIFDIVGRNFVSGSKVLAQCKKNNEAVLIDDRFLQAALADKGDAQYYYFAYGGCCAPVPNCVTVIDKDRIQEWSNTSVGNKYSSIFKDA